MPQIGRPLLILLTASFLIQSASASILNAAFEDGDLSAYTLTTTGTASISVSTTYAHAGSQSAKIDATGVGANFDAPNLRQSFTTTPGDVWNFQGYLYFATGELLAGDEAYLKIVFKDSEGNELDPFAANVGTLITGAFPGVESGKLTSASTSDVWAQFEAEGVAPQGAASVELIVLLLNTTTNNPNSIVYVDTLSSVETAGQIPAINKKLVVVGSSVGRGFGAYSAGTYQNDDLDDVDGNGSADTFATYSYTGRIRSYLLGQGWTFDNQSIGGNNTSAVLARFNEDVAPENAEIVLIALSMGNEGLTFTSDPDSVFASFRDGLQNIILECRNEGYYPVVGLVYPNGLFNQRKYEFVQEMNLLINTWDVPSINLLGATDDGTGKWVQSQQYGTLSSGSFIRFDSAHPNVPGYEEMYHAVVPSLFDAIDQGKTSSPSYPASNSFIRLTPDNAEPAPLTYNPATTLRGFTKNFKVRTKDTGTVAAVRIATEPLFLVDFGPNNDDDGRATSNPDTNGNYWNSWRPAAGGVSIGTGTTLSNLITVGNSATAVSLEVTDGFSGSNGILNGGLDGGDGPSETQLGKLAIETATEDYFFESGTAAFKISGLDPNSLYSFRFFGSRVGTDERVTKYTLESGLPYETFAYQRTTGENIGSNRTYDGNDSEVAYFGGIPPNGSGEITVKVEAAFGSNAYVSLMEVLVDASGNGTDYATIEVRDSSIAYVAPDGREISASVDADDGSWHEVALAHRYAYQETLLFLDGQLAGSLREMFEPDQFILGGSGVLASNAPSSADYQDWSVYRAPWVEAEALAQHTGSLQQASLEILAALDDGTFTQSGNVDNDAQSLSTAVLNSNNATAPTAVTPPSDLAAVSRNSNEVQLSWTDNSTSETGFVLERRAIDDGEAWTTVVILPANTLNYTDGTLEKSTDYSYRISSTEAGCQSGYSNIATVAVGQDGQSYRAWIGEYYDLQPACFRVDFNTNSSPNYGSENWTTVDSLSAGAAYALVDEGGDSSAGYSVRIINSFDQFRSANGNPLAGYDDDAQQTLFVSSTDAPGEAIIELGGLNPDMHYDLAIFARRGVIVANFDYRANYTLSGAEGEIVYEHDNDASDELIESYSIRPSAAGTIRIAIDPPDSNQGTFFAGINFLTLKEVPLPHLIDFNGNGSAGKNSGETWNTLASPSVVGAINLVDVAGNAASPQLQLTYNSAFSQERDGDGTTNKGGIVDLDPEGTLFALSGNNPTPAVMTLSGLDPSLSYQVLLLAKRNNNAGGIDYSGIYTVTGSGSPQSQTVDAADNSEYTVFENVVPNGSGEIQLQVAGNTDGATPTSDFPCLNLLRISVDGSSTGDLPARPTNGDSDSDSEDDGTEYARGLNPTIDDSAPFQFDDFSLNGSTASFEYSRFGDAQDVNYTLQHTPTLENPNWQPVANPQEVILGSDGALDSIQVDTTTNGDQGFYRLQISL